MLLEPEQEKLEQFLDIIEARRIHHKCPVPENERRAILRYIVEAAGYDIVTFEKGVVIYNHRENKATGVRICTYGGSIEPTMWLEMLFNELQWTVYGYKNDRTEVRASLKKWLSKPGPFKPVVISEFGDTAIEPQSDDFTHRGEDTKLGTRLIHETCNSWLSFRSISQEYSSITCPRCYLRVPIPKSLTSIGDLRRHFSHLQPQWQNP